MTERRHDWIALGILTALISLLFLDVIAGLQDLYGGDLLGYAFPYKKVLRDVVLGGEFPYWNRAFSGGQPMAANPAHAVFYPLTWLILLPGFHTGFQWYIVVHLYCAAWFMYAFLRSLALAPAAAFVGALSFAIGGMVLSYTTLLPIFSAIVWIPLTLLFARRFLQHGARRDFVLASVFFAMQLLVGEPTTVIQTGLLLLVYAMSRRGIRGIGVVAMLAVTALLLAAVAVLPAIDHASDSVRARGFLYESVVTWSMPPARLGELLHANLLGHNAIDGRRLYWGRSIYDRGFPFLLSIYPGLLVTVLAATGLIARVRGSRIVLALIAMSVLLALGDFTPLWRLLYEAGLARSIRYPEKFIFMGVFVATVFAAKTFDILLRGDERVLGIARRVAAVIAIAAGAGALVAWTPWHAKLFAAIWSPPPSLIEPMLAAARNGWLMTAGRAALLLILLGVVMNRAPRRIAIAAAAAFVLLDLGLLAPELVRRIDPEFLREMPPVLRNLPPNRHEYRLFHHAAWHRGRREVAAYYLPLPGQRWIDRNGAVLMTPIAHGFQVGLDGDYDYTSLLPSTDFYLAVRVDLPRVRRDWLEIAASMTNVWYRIVYLDPKTAFAAARGEVRDVQPVGVLRMERTPRYAFAPRLETARDRHEFVAKLGAGGAKDTAYIDAPAFAPAPGVVRRVRETANTATIDVETAGRAFLVMSVTPHKYWRINIDGREAPAIVTNVGYQGVVIPAAGRHVVEMRYRNPLIAAGGAISLVTLFVLLVLLAKASRPITMRAL